MEQFLQVNAEHAHEKRAVEMPAAGSPAAAHTASSRLEAGIAVLRQIELDLGNPHGLLHGMRVNAPAFKMRAIELFGDVYAGESALDLNTKLLLAVAFASCQPSEEGLLEFHIGAALKAGWTREQVVAVLEMAAAFVGWPKAIKAVRVAIQTFDKAGLDTVGANK